MSAAPLAASDSGAGMRLIELISTVRAKLLLVAVLVFAGALCELIPPVLMRWIVDEHLAIGRYDGILALAVLYLGAAALGQALTFAYGYLAAATSQDVLRALRVRLFGHFLHLPSSYFDRTPLGDAISRCTADVDTLDTVFTSGVAALVANLFRLVAVAVAMILLSPALFLATAIVLPPLVLVTRFFQVRIRAAERANRLAVADMNTHLQETLRGVEAIQALRREHVFATRFREVLRSVVRAYNRATVYSSFYPPLTALMTYSTIALMIWAGTREGFADAGISIGTLAAFALLVQRFFTPLTALGDEWQTIQGALSGAERIFGALALPSDVPQMNRQRVSGSNGLVCEQVVFGYNPNEPVLRGVTIAVAPGEHVALVGRTGAGKSSIVHLAAGLYTPWQGSIKAAGQDPRTLTDDEKRRVIGIVPQVTQLFTGTVLDNLTLKDMSVTESMVIDAARLSGADAFIRALPDGYGTMLRGTGKGLGIQLSAGQEQLLALTRALVMRPAVLLLDEATSLLDGASDTTLRAALRAKVLAQGTAVLTVAHKLTTAREADRIIVLEQGRVLEEGTPAALLACDSRFAALLELERAGWEWRTGA
jgi:ATP-binding cassette subfamily B protein